MKRALKYLGIGMNVLLILVVVMSAGLAFVARRSGERSPAFFGHKIFMVVSGSMEPVIHTGDVIIVRPLAEVDAVNEGDIITFRTKEGGNTIITHRVVGAVNVNGEPKAFVTKGDANDTMDGALVSRAQIVGRYAWRVPYFGYVATFLRQPLGIILCLILPGLIVIGTEFRKMYKALEAAEATKADGGDDDQQTG